MHRKVAIGSQTNKRPMLNGVLSPYLFCFLTLCALPTLFGCETSPPLPEVVKEAPSSIVLDLLIQRSPRFQRFHLVKDLLWQECGDLVDESFAPSETHVSVISESERRAVLARLGELLSANEVTGSLPEVEDGERKIIELTIHDDDRTTVLRTPEDGPNQGLANQKALRQLVAILSKRRVVACEEGNTL